MVGAVRGFAGGGAAAEALVLGHDHGDEHDPIGHTHTAYEPVFVRKSADETVNNSATLQDDDALGKLLTVSSTYEFELLILYNSGATPDLKFGFTGPAGSSANWAAISNSTPVVSVPKVLADTLTVDGTGADATVLVKGIFVMGATAGGLQLQWAQATANASNTIVRAGSYLRIRKVA